MLQSNVGVLSGMVTAALVVVACNDSTPPRSAPQRPSFSTGGSPACFRVTGGGRIDRPEPSTPFPQPKNPDHDFATFGLHAGPTACNSTAGSGEIHWVEHSRTAPGHGFKFHGTVTSFFAVQDHYFPDRVCASFSGSGRARAHDHSFDQDVSFTVDHACDEGEPGKGRDHVRMVLSGGTYDRAGILTGGNIHQHSLKGAAAATTGALMVSNTTTGASFPASYTVTVDAGTASATSQAMVPKGSVTFNGLPAGSHSVTLTVASNCTVSSTTPNPQTVNVPAGGTGSAAFTVSCTTPPTTGTLMVSNSTTGSSFPASYTVTVDAGTASATSQAMVPNGSVPFSGLPAGSHGVTLTVASNCTVSSTTPNPQTVNVPAGGTGSAAFTVSCTTPPTTGNLTVSNTTTGSSFPTSYTVTVDAGTASAITQTMVPNGNVPFNGLPAGSHSVTLTVASNCTVSSTTPNPQTVNVPAGGTGSASFTVSCTAPTGTATLNVTTQTTGAAADLDADGYRVVLDGTDRGTIGVNSTAQFTGLAAGDHTVELIGVAANCTVISTNPVTGPIAAGTTVSLTFSVSCGAPATNTRVTGLGAIGPGTATAGSDRQEFDFDVTGAPGGRVAVTDFIISERLIVDADPATAITSFSRISVACVRFGGIARVEPTGGTVRFFIDACDNASPGTGADTFTITVPAASLTRSGTLREGDIAISTF